MFIYTQFSQAIAMLSPTVPYANINTQKFNECQTARVPHGEENNKERERERERKAMPMFA